MTTHEDRQVQKPMLPVKQSNRRNVIMSNLLINSLFMHCVVVAAAGFFFVGGGGL